MAIDRSNTFNENTSPPLSGTAFLTQYGDYLDALIDVATLRLTNVGGTANAITATAEPFQIPASGLVAGANLILVPAVNNTGAATLDIDGRGAATILKGDGTNITADTLVANTSYLLSFRGAAFFIVGSEAEVSSSGLLSVQVFTTSSTYTKPAGIKKVLVEVIGAGGGGGGSGSSGGKGGGAGGGGAAVKFLDISAIASATVTIGAGGAGAGQSGIGGTGAASSWADGTNFISATGGTGGSGVNSGSGSGGTGGLGSGGDINLGGQGGGSAGDNGPSGAGGSSQRGGGAQGRTTGTPGNGFPGRSFGGGGGGSLSFSNQRFGGAGAAGVVIIWEYS